MLHRYKSIPIILLLYISDLPDVQECEEEDNDECDDGENTNSGQVDLHRLRQKRTKTPITIGKVLQLQKYNDFFVEI